MILLVTKVLIIMKIIKYKMKIILIKINIINIQNIKKLKIQKIKMSFGRQNKINVFIFLI